MTLALDGEEREADAVAEGIRAGVLLHPTASALKLVDRHFSAIGAPPPPVLEAVGFYQLTAAYKDVMSWPMSVWTAYKEGRYDDIPPAYRELSRPVHDIALAVMATAADRASNLQISAVKELTDRVEGPVEHRTRHDTRSISYVVVAPLGAITVPELTIGDDDDQV